MTSLPTLLIVLALGLLVLFILSLTSEPQQENDTINSALMDLEQSGFVVDDFFNAGNVMLAYDNKNRRIATVTEVFGRKKVSFYEFETIRECEIIKYSVTTRKKLYKNSVAVTLPLYFDVTRNGLNKRTECAEKIDALLLKIYFNSFSQPSETIPFILNTTPVSSQERFIAEAEKWNDKISAIVDENEKMLCVKTQPQQLRVHTM